MDHAHRKLQRSAENGKARDDDLRLCRPRKAYGGRRHFDIALRKTRDVSSGIEFSALKNI